MDAISNEENNQLAVVPAGRRGFMRKACAAALAAVAAAGVPARASTAIAEPVSQGPVAPDLREYNRETLAYLCLQAELMREWFEVYDKKLSATHHRMGVAAYDLTIEAFFAAREIQRAAGIELDKEYIAARKAEFLREAMGGAA